MGDSGRVSTNECNLLWWEMGDYHMGCYCWGVIHSVYVGACR